MIPASVKLAGVKNLTETNPTLLTNKSIFKKSESDFAWTIESPVTKLGSGAVGTVLLGRCGACSAAIKFSKEARFNPEIMQEAHLLKGLHHPNIVRLLHFENAAGSAKAMLALELLGDNLLAIQENNKATEIDFWEAARSLLAAAKYIHGKMIAHTDLTASNVGARPSAYVWTLVVFDFDGAIQLEHADQRVERKPAKMLYWSPEAWANGSYSPLAEDIYSTGQTLQEIVAASTLSCRALVQFLDRMLCEEGRRLSAQEAFDIIWKMERGDAEWSRV